MVWRRNELKSCVVPVVVAQRPAVGETHPRDKPPPPPLPTQPAPIPRLPISARPPLGTVANIAGESYDEVIADSDADEEENETFRDEPALTARFGGIKGVAAAEGVLYSTDGENNRIRGLHGGVVHTLAGTGEERPRDGDRRFRIDQKKANFTQISLLREICVKLAVSSYT